MRLDRLGVRGAFRAAVLVTIIAMPSADLLAQCCCGGGGGGGRGRRQSVGGVYIDAAGVLLNAEADDRAFMRELRRKALERVPGEMDEPTELRKVSLARLQEAIAELMQTGKPLPIEMRMLAGLQNVRYVLIYPEENDIVLAGYAEGLQADALGNVVGKSTKRPALMLDDLLVALRTARRASQGGITCSIDPTQEGLQRLRDYVSRISRAEDVSTNEIERALGPQQIRIGGVPASSHFARVLVAADYRMKQIGMGHEKSPVA
ncbi:MAG TPA: DUF1598 domain-containing protein, partial [Pirellulales bacterium]|nr:DUF1598 domain-containing protein [Pirellulales bacterium]